MISSEERQLWNGKIVFLEFQDWWAVSSHVQPEQFQSFTWTLEAYLSTPGLFPKQEAQPKLMLNEQIDQDGKMIFPRKVPPAWSKMLPKYIAVNKVHCI